MAQSGSTLPQVSATNGSISGTFHIVTTDGAGPVSAMVDSTGTGAFSSGTKAAITTQVPGKGGNIAAPKQRRFLPRTLVKMGLLKRASNVNEDYVSFFLPISIYYEYTNKSNSLLLSLSQLAPPALVPPLV